VVHRIHEHISNRRHDFVHQTARQIVNRFGLIVVEKLNILDISRLFGLWNTRQEKTQRTRSLLPYARLVSG
jgi:IS605 OrfB family transposase